MASYLILFGFTERGIENVKESPARVEAARQVVRDMGGEVKAFYGILGSQHDTMFVIDAPDERAVARMVLAIASKGFVRTMTHRLFDDEEYRDAIGSLP